ncbi:hypothetical protein O181_082506, partial [Austropuccinia psidii MF-1]|nr:hypothetical protein [Austropuccinia psidii MF-1]
CLQTTQQRIAKPLLKFLVEETCERSPTPVFTKKKKAKKLFFPGPTIQDSEEEVPNTPSNQIELESEVELIPQKGKERAKSPVEQNPHKEVPYPKDKSQRFPLFLNQNWN